MTLSITITTPNFPTPEFPEHGIFVYKCAEDWQTENCKVQVLHPRSWADILRTLYHQKVAGSKGKISIDIKRPTFVSLSNKKIGPINTHNISRKAYQSACRRAQRRQAVPDIFYGKFLMSGGRAAVELGGRYGRPSFIDLGESSLLETLSEKEKTLAQQLLRQATGVVCVSARLAEEARTLGVAPENILLKPNQVDRTLFIPFSQEKARATLGLPKDGLIAAFTGHFIERKGPLRVVAALEQLQQQNVKAIFLGRGPQKPEGDRVLFAGAVEHDELPLWLNAADFFVLPTLAEGNCNAINEAQAVGLPVITSDIPDTQQQVPDNTGIRVPPHDIQELSHSIHKLASDSSLRSQLKNQAIELSDNRNRTNRNKEILDWINSKIGT